MQFKQLDVYVQLTRDNDLKARVVQMGVHSRIYGANLLKGYTIANRDIAMAKVGEKLVGRCERIRFTFEPKISNQVEMYEYPSA
jgi:hypothetical protein